MSNLRDRLKQISQRPQAAQPAPVIAPCREIESTYPSYGITSIPAQIMLLLGGGGDMQSILFLDTETTGLGGGAGTLAFLVGIGRVEGDGRLRVRQYLMTDYDQEEYLLTKLYADIKRADALVTYNGKSFDIPLLRSRLVMHRLRPDVLDMPHIDLLHLARRVYKRRLKRCSLSDMEENVLDLFRESDLPGALVPEYWFRYLKTGEEALLDEILKHNRQDIASLAHLLKVLADAYSGPEQLSFELDRLSVGKAMEKLGETGRAKAYYRAAERHSEALIALARIHRRAGSVEEAIKALESASRMDGDRILAMTELSKLYEHRLRDCAAALEWADKAIAESLPADIAPLLHRRDRLCRKIIHREE